MGVEKCRTKDKNLVSLLSALDSYRTARSSLPRDIARNLYTLAESTGNSKPLISRDLFGQKDPLLPNVPFKLKTPVFQIEPTTQSSPTTVELALEYQVIRVIVPENLVSVVIAQERPYVRVGHGDEDVRPKYIALLPTETDSISIYDLYDGELLATISGETPEMYELRTTAHQTA